MSRRRPKPRQDRRPTPPERKPLPAADAAVRRVPTLALAVCLITLVVLLAAWLYLSAEHRIAGDWGYSLDDSWIYATFARNLATGHGFSFNPGESVGGATGVLYALILAILYLVFHEVIWTAKIFGVLCHIGAAIAIYCTMTALLPARRSFALLAALIVASSPPLVWGMLSGMEIPLYLLLVCGGLAYYVRSRPLVAMILWSIGVWARPDGLFLVALGALGPPREIVRRLAVAAPVLIAYFALNVAIGGHWIPQSVGAKAHWGLDLGGRTYTMMREWGELWGVPFRRSLPLDEPVLLLPFFLLGAVLTFRRWPMLTLYAIGFPLGLSLFQSGVMNEKRYILYVIPFGVVLAALAWNQIESWMAHRWRQVGITVGAVCLAAQGLILPHRAEQYGWNVQNINKMQIILAKFAKLATQPGDAIAVNDIGAMGYFSDRYVVDLLGLVTPARTLPEALDRYQPKLLIIFPGWFREYARDDSATGNYKFFDSDGSHRYELLAGVSLKKNTICGAHRMAVYLRLGSEDPSPAERWLYSF